MEASVVVPCWLIDEHLLHLTYECFDSIRSTSDVELIVIDNGSLIGGDYMKQEADVYVRNEVNLGFTKAINQGLQLAKCDNTLVVNNDVMLHKGCIQGLNYVTNTKEDCGAVLPAFEEAIQTNELWKEGVTGSCFMISRNTLNRVGLFDEQFFNRYSDLDYVIRMNKSGLECYGTNHARATHKHSSSLKKLNQEDNDREYFAGMRKFLVKWHRDTFVLNKLRDCIGDVKVDELLKSI